MANHERGEQLSIVDALLGRHQHVPQMKVTMPQRVYHNYRVHQESFDVEIATGGRHRNKSLFDDPANPVAQTVRKRGY